MKRRGSNGPEPVSVKPGGKFASGANAERVPDFYLPDFCAARAVFAVVLISAIVAIALTLAREDPGIRFFTELSRVALLMLWMGLASAAVLCASRSTLASRSIQAGSLIAFSLVMLTILVVSEAVYWLGYYYFGAGAVSAWFPANHGTFLFRNLAVGAVVTALALRYFYISHEWRRNVEQEAAARIQALEARIRPHFLFNSMNTIAALIPTNPDAAEQTVEDLADLFRASLSRPGELVTLGEELDIVRLYERMECQRLGDRLKIAWQLAEVPEEILMPGLSLQPLVENAIYHGIEPLPGGGTITIDATTEANALSLSVSNPLAGNAQQRTHSGNRLALDNIRQRLELAFGSAASLDVNQDDARFVVTMRIPIDR